MNLLPSVSESRRVLLLRPDRLSEDLRSAIVQHDLKSGETLYRRGDPALFIYALERGRVRLFSHTTEGRMVPVYNVYAGEYISEAALYADNYCSDVIADSPSRVAAIPKKVLIPALETEAALAAQFTQRLTQRFNLLRVRLEIQSLQSARGRVLEYLRVLAQPGEISISIDRPLKSIADEVGLSHESFYRTLTSLIREGLLTRTKNKIMMSAARTGKQEEL